MVVLSFRQGFKLAMVYLYRLPIESLSGVNAINGGKLDDCGFLVPPNVVNGRRLTINIDP